MYYLISSHAHFPLSSFLNHPSPHASLEMEDEGVAPHFALAPTQVDFVLAGGQEGQQIVDLQNVQWFKLGWVVVLFWGTKNWISSLILS